MKEHDPLDLRSQEREKEDRETRDRLERENEEADIKWLMSSKKGRRVMWRLLDQAGVFKLSFNTNAMTMAFAEGNRNYETLMTEAEQTNNADASQPADQGAPSYGGDLIGDKQQSTAEDQSQQAQGEANTGEEQGNESEAQDSVLGSPESYELKAQTEDFVIDDVVGQAFKDIAKELDLSNAAAQKVVDKVGPVLAQRQQEQLQTARNMWGEQSQADKEFGGEQLAENLSVAGKALDAFATPELRELLQQSGLGNHPEVIRFMVRTGKAIDTDKYVGPSTGSNAPRNAPKDMAGYASALYKNQQTS